MRVFTIVGHMLALDEACRLVIVKHPRLEHVALEMDGTRALVQVFDSRYEVVIPLVAIVVHEVVVAIQAVCIYRYPNDTAFPDERVIIIREGGGHMA